MNVPGLDRWWTGRLTIKTEEMVFLYHSSILKHILWKESWNKDGQWFNQNQQSERPPLISNHWTHKKNLAYGIGNPSYGMEQAQKCGRIKPVEGISTHIKSATDICHDYFTLKFLQWRISFGYLLLFSFFFGATGPKYHVSYYHHFASVDVMVVYLYVKWKQTATLFLLRTSSSVVILVHIQILRCPPQPIMKFH